MGAHGNKKSNITKGYKKPNFKIQASKIGENWKIKSFSGIP